MCDTFTSDGGNANRAAWCSLWWLRVALSDGRVLLRLRLRSSPPVLSSTVLLLISAAPSECHAGHARSFPVPFVMATADTARGHTAPRRTARGTSILGLDPVASIGRKHRRQFAAIRAREPRRE